MVGGRRRGSRGFLTRAGKSDDEEVLDDGAVDVLVGEENADGWFNSMISYPNYKYIFPIKALGMFATKYGNPTMV